MEELEDLRDALNAAQAYAAYQQAPEAVRPWREIRAKLVAAGHQNCAARRGVPKFVG